MDMKSMSAKELIKVIEACGKAGVTALRIADIEISFKAQPIEQATFSGTEPFIPFIQTTTTTTPLSQEDTELSEKIDQDIEEMNLLIEDPAEWERRHTSPGGH